MAHVRHLLPQKFRHLQTGKFYHTAHDFDRTSDWSVVGWIHTFDRAYVPLIGKSWSSPDHMSPDQDDQEIPSGAGSWNKHMLRAVINGA